MKASRAERGTPARGRWWIATAIVFACDLIVTGAFS
jgi:hypothetical protein